MTSAKKSNNQYYFVFVWGDVEPEIHGPYKTPQSRFKAVRASVKENGLDGNSHFWLDNVNGKLEIGTYASSDFSDIVENEECV